MGAEVDDESGYAVFVREHWRSLYGTAYLLTGNKDAAEELLQDTLVRLYPKWHQVASADVPVAYVRRAVTNAFVSSGRRASARDLPMWDLPDRADAVDVSEQVANRRLLWQLLQKLSERPRAAVVLRYFHDLPDDEIANALGCRLATVRSLISRGTAVMKAEFERGRADALPEMRGES
jgi:RNA polymerase sigma-70 factor (sigma-E family)